MSGDVHAGFCERRGVGFPPATHPIIVTAMLRSVVRRAGLAAVRRHWPGTPDGFTVLCRLTGLREPNPTPRPPA